MNTTTTVEAPKTALARLTEPLDETSAITLRTMLDPLLTGLESWQREAALYVVDGDGDPKKEREAGDLRRKIKRNRIALVKNLETLKEPAKRQIDIIGAVTKIVVVSCDQLEDQLEASEKWSASLRKQREAALAEARAGELRGLGVLDVAMPAALGAMAEDSYAEVVRAAREAKDARDEQARVEAQIAEETRQRVEAAAREKREQEARDRETKRVLDVGLQRAEVLRALGVTAEQNVDWLGGVSAEEWAEARTQAEARRDERLASEKSAREAAEAEAKAEREKAAEEKRVADAALAAEREAAETAARLERERTAEVQRKADEARAAAEAEAARLRQAEADRLAREEADRQAAEAEAERLAAAPDKVQLETVAPFLRAVTLPECKTAKGRALVEKIRSRVEKLCADIDAAVAKL